MSAVNERTALERLRAAVGEYLGFAFEDDQLEQLGHTVRGRIAELGLEGVNGYVKHLRSRESASDEIFALAELLTARDTFFFRSQEQIEALIDELLRVRATQGGRRLRILSAGCASGEEPYSLAIALREAFPDLDAWDVKIFALDVNASMLEKAARARYAGWSLRATPEPIRTRYFRSEGREYVLDPEVKRLVEFRQHNLAEPEPLFFRAVAADAVFCRNVIMYFTPETMQRVIGQLTEALLPGGLLFLGHAETLRGLSHDFHLRHANGTFYYQLREGTPSVRAAARARQSSYPEEAATLPAAILGAGSWYEAMQAATLREPAARESAPPSADFAGDAAIANRMTPPPPSPRSELTAVLDLVERKRFDEALAVIENLPPDASRHPDALLFSAVLLANGGRLAEAERACRSLLALDELHAGAHYLTALCREHAGDARGAAEHNRIAVHLDPTFAMPHLHAGLLARRAGDSSAARHELGQALVLLEREDTSRLVLFGGGFSRQALTSLCRSELGRLRSTL